MNLCSVLRWFTRADEGAAELAVNLRRNGLNINPFVGKIGTSILDPVNPSGFKIDIDKARLREFGPVVLLF